MDAALTVACLIFSYRRHCATQTNSPISPSGRLKLWGSSHSPLDRACLFLRFTPGSGVFDPVDSKETITGSRLIGVTALVTGSTSDIGRAIATAFAAKGAHVIVNGRNEERGAEVVEITRATDGQVDFVVAHLDGSPATSKDLAARAT